MGRTLFVSNFVRVLFLPWELKKSAVIEPQRKIKAVSNSCGNSFFISIIAFLF